MSQSECLEYLKMFKHGTSKEIADYYKFSPSAVQHNLRALVKNGMPVYYTIEHICQGRGNSTYVWHYKGDDNTA